MATSQLFDKAVLDLLRIDEKTGPALIWRRNAQEDETYSYKQLSSESLLFAEKLRECDIPKNSYVAFMADDLSYHCIPAIIIGTLRHGCAFVPLTEIGSSIANLNIKYLATDLAVNTGDLIGECTVFGKIWHIVKRSEAAPNAVSHGSDYAYKVTTSGSTGTPKVVQVPHKAIVPNIVYLIDRFGITSSDIILQCAPPSFDPFVVELFMAFHAGATLLMIPPLEKSQPSSAFNIIVRKPNPTVIQATPSFICNLSTSNLKELLGPRSDLKILAFGGEPCPAKNQLLQWRSADNKTRIFNLYGVTEVSCWSTCEELDFSNNEEIFLGDSFPFNQVQVRSLDDGSLLKSGVGQIFLTTLDRMCTINGETLRGRWHATGDLAQVWPNGKYSFVDRMSGKRDLKILGQKVSIEEIERQTMQLESIKNCAVLTNVSSILKIVLYVVPIEALKIGKAELQHEVLAQLHRVLPAVAIPNLVVIIKKLPLTLHGKLDQRKLLLIANRQLRRPSSKRSIGEVEQQVREAWVLSLGPRTETEILRDSLFLSNGGDSVKAMHFYARLLTAAGIHSEEPRLLTTILEKSFSDIASCFALLMKQRSQSEPDIDVSKIKRCKILANQSNIQSGQILFSASRGQICFHKSNAHETEINSAACPSYREHWKADFGKCIDASPLAVQYNDGLAVVCVGSHSGKFACIDIHTGNELWSIFLGDRIEATASLSNFGTFFVGCYDGALYNIDFNGAMLWKFQTKGIIKSSAATILEDVLIGSYDQSLYCVKQKTGDLIWEIQLKRGAIYANPVVIGTSVVVVTLGGYVICIDPQKRTEKWLLQQGKPFFTSPVVINHDFVMVGNVSGLISCIDVSNGTVVSTLQAEGDLFSSFALLGSQLFYADKLNVVQFDLQTRKIVNSYAIGERITSTAMLLGNILAVASSRCVFLFDTFNCILTQTLSMPKEVFSSPVLLRDYLIFGCRNNILYCYKKS